MPRPANQVTFQDCRPRIWCQLAIMWDKPTPVPHHTLKYYISFTGRSRGLGGRQCRRLGGAGHVANEANFAWKATGVAPPKTTCPSSCPAHGRCPATERCTARGVAPFPSASPLPLPQFHFWPVSCSPDCHHSASVFCLPLTFWI